MWGIYPTPQNDSPYCSFLLFTVFLLLRRSSVGDLGTCAESTKRKIKREKKNWELANLSKKRRKNSFSVPSSSVREATHKTQTHFPIFIFIFILYSPPPGPKKKTPKTGTSGQISGQHWPRRGLQIILDTQPTRLRALEMGGWEENVSSFYTASKWLWCLHMFDWCVSSGEKEARIGGQSGGHSSCVENLSLLMRPRV